MDAPGWKTLGEFPEFADILAPSAPAFAGAVPVSASAGYSIPAADPVAVAATLKLPAILLIIFGVLGLLLTLAGPFLKKFWIETELHMFEQLNVPLPPESRSAMEAAASSGFQAMDAFFMALGLTANSVILAGGLKMRKVQSWGLCLAAVILMMLPCGGFCCCIGLPLGIWMTILLNKPEVKSAFR